MCSSDLQALLYTEVHEQVLGADGAVQTGVTTYTDPQGRPMARKVLDFRQHRTIPIYTLQQPEQRYSEGVHSIQPQLSLFKRNGESEDSERLTPRDGLVAADEGFNQLIQAQLPRLAKGETVAFTLVVAGYLDQFRFRAKAVSGQLAGPDAPAEPKLPPLVLRVEPDSLLRMVAPAITLFYDARTRQLLRYEGVSNIVNPATGKVFERVVIEYAE